METLENIVASVSGVLSDYVLVTLLLIAALWFTFHTRGV